ncbi:MAG: cytochrome P450 [Sphingomonadaceae bacterium]|nr:cytochrome P450 [Sphingomonadaceae bacterium]
MGIEYDPYSDEAMTDATEFYRQMRAEGCPHHIEKYDAWAFTRFDDVKSASLKGKCLDFTHGQTPGQVLLGEEVLESFSTKNGAEHRKWRGVIAGDFTQQAVQAQVPRYRELARRLWLENRDRGQLDVYRDYANRFFCINAGYKLGLPGEDGERYRALIDDILHRERGQKGATSQRNQQAFAELAERLGAYIAEIREHPERATGFTKAYMEAEIDGRRLTDHELLLYMITLLIVGSETTPMVIAAFFYYLAQHPEQKAAVLADHSLIRQAFLETARFHQPTNMLARTALDDFEIAGQQICKGQKLLFVYASANRDEAQFDRPDAFDIFRSDLEPNMTFGMGSHVCLGMHVGIEAGIIIIEEMLKDIENFDVEFDKVERAYGEHLSGFIGMPVRFTLKS